MRSSQELRSLLSGPVMSVHTPFMRDGAIDYDSLRGLVDRGIEAGSTNDAADVWGQSFLVADG